MASYILDLIFLVGLSELIRALVLDWSCIAEVVDEKAPESEFNARVILLTMTFGSSESVSEKEIRLEQN